MPNAGRHTDYFPINSDSSGTNCIGSVVLNRCSGVKEGTILVVIERWIVDPYLHKDLSKRIIAQVMNIGSTGSNKISVSVKT